ncbi:tRNA 2-thiouridine(34) synthase MnmA [Streptacidiphilus neutrinimicus]|uniref:tRNA 2-thiouridine(34) synthase MnmA n=1 Tax=Streptacidiphilus neutrinimicus TaxID=105420 RepID=UPI0005A6153F|nr:tRNA 2-thiouridine(34) synthase MnmA [Streptacidiphilus neutrinimicus]
MSDFPGAPAPDSSALPGGKLRVLAAMSGGVDSAVAAARAVEQGHEVTGVHLALASNPQSFRTGARGCCTLEDSRDARRAADVLGIPFYVWDLAERFREDVIDDFVAEYAAGRTPNPCLRCNEKIKFAALLDKAIALGFDAVCTGHYARIVDHSERGRELHRAVDPAKDQSYVLGVLTAPQLAHAMFPLGDTTKDQVRVEAERRGLAVAKKPDSHDICFIADGDTQGFLAQRLGTAPGEIVDVDGAVVGEHSGAYGFTIGQRKGLRIGRPAADGKPRYVLDISPVDNRVTVGPAEALEISALTGVKPRWCGAEPPYGTGRYLAQIRAHGEQVPVTAEVAEDGGLRVVLDQPLRGIAPGQAVVLYDGTRVLGSATIATTERAAESAAAQL